MAPATKRRKLNNQVEEITFDPAARQEYLTGFHKRKLQRIENAREAAAKKEKEERVRERRQIREQRKEDLEKRVAEINAELRKQNPDLSESDGLDDAEAGGVKEEWQGIEDGAVPEEDAEFVDEDKYTTVTVEAMGEDAGEEDQDAEAERVSSAKINNGGSGAPKKKTQSKDGKPKAKKKKFRYESKAERQTARQKQKLKKRAAKVRRTEG